MFSNASIPLVTIALCSIVVVYLLGHYRAKSAWRRGFQRGFAMGQSHELDAALRLYAERFTNSTSFVLASYVGRLRKLEHRS